MFYGIEKHNKYEIINKTRLDVSYTSYDYINKVFYQMGPGGVIRTNLKDQTSNVIDDRDINIIKVYEDNTYFYVNNGFKENGYDSEICDSNKICYQIGYPVDSFEVWNDKIYIILAGLRSTDSFHFLIFNIENNQIEQINEIEYAFIFKGIDSIYIVHQDSIRDIKSNQTWYFNDDKSTYLDSLSSLQAVETKDEIVLVSNRYLDSTFQFINLNDNGTISDTIRYYNFESTYYAGNEKFILTSSSTSSYGVYDISADEFRVISVPKLDDSLPIFILPIDVK